VAALLVFATFLASVTALAAPDAAKEFTESVRPVLAANCGTCHNPANPKNKIDFLKAQTVNDIENKRGMWRSVAIQMRNRTMPPVASKLTEDDRLRISAWVENRLRETACSLGDYSGAVAPRRLNRREYHNTIRDLLGVDLAVAEAFPADESGGAGFDTNGETLYIPPMLLERYMEAAGKVLDRAIVTPPLNKVFPAQEMTPRTNITLPGGKPGRMLQPGQELTVEFPIFVDGQYSLRVSVERPREVPFNLEVNVDGAPGGSLPYGRDRNGGPTARAHNTTFERGVHKVSIVAGKEPVLFYSFTVEQRAADSSPDKKALHHRLFGLEPGEAPIDPRAAARRLLATFVPKAYRRPVEPAEIDRFLALCDRGVERGDPYEERIKLALKAVLVSPRFLFRIEDRAPDSKIKPIGHYDLASRLSYFLWATMPDAELLSLAEQGKLQDPKTLTQQVDRMLDDPRSRAFASAFVGQWLGTQDIGGRAVPLLTELQHYYTPDVAADLRQEPVLLFHHIVGGNRSLLELLTANYTFLTERLGKFYQVDGKVKGLSDTFQRVEWPDNRRAGVLGFASVLAMTSHYKQGSPVLRGAWVLDTLLGTPVPAPPPDVPPLEKASKSDAGLSMRQILGRHRADPTCSTCHNLMDPIGFGLENFDWMGRWRDEESNGKPVDASGVLPSGEKFNGAAELRQVLLDRKDDFVSHLTGKVLGYALGRSLQDGDHCTVQRLTQTLKQNNYSARTLIREIVLSVPFRNTQGGVEPLVTSGPAPKRSTRRLLGEK
jgi:cytochrome c553